MKKKDLPQYISGYTNETFSHTWRYLLCNSASLCFPAENTGNSILHVFCIDTAVVTLPEVKNEALSRTKKIPAMGPETHRHQDLLRCCWLVFGQTPKGHCVLKREIPPVEVFWTKAGSQLRDVYVVIL